MKNLKSYNEIIANIIAKNLNDIADCRSCKCKR